MNRIATYNGQQGHIRCERMIKMRRDAGECFQDERADIVSAAMVMPDTIHIVPITSSLPGSEGLNTRTDTT